MDKLERESWLNLGSFICVESHRKDLITKQSSVEKRYYLSDHKPDAAENVALLRKLALNLLRADQTVKDTIQGKRLRAAFDENILEQLMGLKVS